MTLRQNREKVNFWSISFGDCARWVEFQVKEKKQDDENAGKEWGNNQQQQQQQQKEPSPGDDP